ncbi:Rieske (2Fe-2S) protein [Chloroflexota bacterium]
MTDVPSVNERYIFATHRHILREANGHCVTAQAGGHTLALFLHQDQVYAVDNRCPHMGFPLEQGTVKDGILTCHWHHARFDLNSGGTFDLWADDVRAFPVQLRGEEVWVDVTPPSDRRGYHRARLRDGLERNLTLVIAKSVIALLDGPEADPAEPFRIGLEFGTAYRSNGWGQGLTILASLMNMLPRLNPADRPRAMVHGLSAVAQDSAGWSPRFAISPLPEINADLPTLRRWFRQFVEVRDAEGAERCIVSAIQQGADSHQMADMLCAAATDHRYIQTGHVLDFTNKAFEALDLAGWEFAAPVLGSLARSYATAERMEEVNAWRNPIDLIGTLGWAFDRIPAALRSGRSRRATYAAADHPTTGLVNVLLGDSPQAIVESLLATLREGCPETDLAGLLAYVAALRLVRFPISNEYSDWDTALHTFTFANAVQQGLRRIGDKPLHGDTYIPLVRGIFDAAMSIYLDRFLNIPAARIPEPDGTVAWDPEVLLAELPRLLDRQQQVDEAGRLVAGHLYVGGSTDRLLALLGELLLREDRDFHTIQAIEAAFKQYAMRRASEYSTKVLIGATRYLAAHAPTPRAQAQTYNIAARLHRGDKLFEES